MSVFSVSVRSVVHGKGAQKKSSIECLCGETGFLVSRTVIVALVRGLIGSRVLCNIVGDSCKRDRHVDRMKPVLLLENLDMKTCSSKDM